MTDLGYSCNDFVFLCFGRYHRKKNFSSVLNKFIEKTKIKNFSMRFAENDVS